MKLDWINSPSDDVISHKILRRNIHGHSWTTIAEVVAPDTMSIFYDTLASYLYTYDYRIVAEDESGNTISTKFFEAKPIDNGIRSSVQTLSAEPNRRKKAVELKWGYEYNPDLYYFMIYRNLPGEPVRSYRRVDVTPELLSELPRDKKNENLIFFLYEDKGVKMDTNYEYQVQALYYGGASSRLGEKVLAEY